MIVTEIATQAHAADLIADSHKLCQFHHIHSELIGQIQQVCSHLVGALGEDTAGAAAILADILGSTFQPQHILLAVLAAVVAQDRVDPGIAADLTNGHIAVAHIALAHAQAGAKLQLQQLGRSHNRNRIQEIVAFLGDLQLAEICVFRFFGVEFTQLQLVDLLDIQLVAFADQLDVGCHLMGAEGQVFLTAWALICQVQIGSPGVFIIRKVVFQFCCTTGQILQQTGRRVLPAECIVQQVQLFFLGRGLQLENLRRMEHIGQVPQLLVTAGLVQFPQ